MKYQTKRRRQTKNKIAVLVSAVIIASAVINYQNVLAVDYPVADVQVRQEQVEYTIAEHVNMIMKDEFNLSFEEMMEANALIACESSYNPWAIGDGGHSLGLWQIHGGYHDISEQDRFDVYFSTRWSIQKYIDSGRSWRLWSCGK